MSDLTAGELILRRKLEKREADNITATVYLNGQHQASLVGDDAIVSYCQEGFGLQMFCTKDSDGDWVLKTPYVLRVAPDGYIETAKMAWGYRISDESIRAIQAASKKKGAARTKQTTPDSPSE